MTLPLYALEFDTSGQAVSPDQPDRLIAESRRAGVTDLIFLAHGFRCNTADATALYTALLTNLVPQLADLTHRTFAAVGVYWPSQNFPESARTSLAGLRSLRPAAIDHAESLLNTVAVSRNTQDEFVASVLSAFDDGSNDPTEGLPLLHQLRGSDLLEIVGHAIPPADHMEGGVLAIPHPILRGIDIFLNFMSWSAMKNLSGKVGASGLAASVLACQSELAATRIHLTGHSLGGRLMTACCKALAQRNAKPIASLSLLEAAFSHFGFSADAVSGQPGFFRSVIESRIVGGPMISTFSKQDAVVGAAYAVASRLAHDSLQSIGDPSDPYGGIGHNGAQRTAESTVEDLHQAGQPYRFAPGILTCLDGSVGPGSVGPGSVGPGSVGPGSVGPGSAGLITGHGDITNPHVTYAIASAVSACT